MRTGHISAIALLGALTSMILASCSQDPIFAAIETEEKIREASVVGAIHSIFALGSDIYVSNGYVLRRTGGTGDWDKLDTPTDYGYGLATDGTDVFGLFLSGTESTTGSVYVLESDDSWSSVPGSSGVEKIVNGSGQILAFRVDNASRNAYSLTSAGMTAIPGATGLSPIIGGVSFGGVSYFATTAGVYDVTGTAVSGAPNANISALTATAEALYVAAGSTIYQWTGGVWTSHAASSSPITGLSYLPLTDPVTGGTRQGILLYSGGSKDGYREMIIDRPAGIPVLASTQLPGTADYSSIKTQARDQYTGTVGMWNTGTIFAAPAAGANDYVLYAAVIYPLQFGLWAYYPVSQPNWNRE